MLKENESNIACNNLKSTCKENARLFKILSNPTRLEILCHLLIYKEVCVKNLSEFLGRRQPNVSQNLALLRNTGMVDFVRKDNRICYSLKDKKLIGILKILASEKLEEDDLLYSPGLREGG
ncbi:MAG: ArsR/SmtB family transcription factor [Nitrospinota bacterium]